jgi:hypothetical protein
VRLRREVAQLKMQRVLKRPVALWGQEAIGR